MKELCPAFEDCPYLNTYTGECALDDPMMDCDDYFYAYGDQEEEEE